jgi:hypothetical protein
MSTTKIRRNKVHLKLNKVNIIFLIRDKKATGDEDVAGKVLKLLGEDDLKLMT